MSAIARQRAGRPARRAARLSKEPTQPWSCLPRASSLSNVACCNSGSASFSAAAGFAMALLLVRFPLAQMLGKPVEAVLPELPVEIDPLGRLAQLRRAQPAAPMLAVRDADEQVGLLEHLQMPRDGRQRNRERRGQLADRRFTGRQPYDDGAAHRIRQGGKGTVEVGSRVHLTNTLINWTINRAVASRASRGRLVRAARPV